LPASRFGREAALFRRGGLRATGLRAVARFGAFDGADRRAFAGFRDLFAFFTPRLALRLAIVPAPWATLTVLR
jgi:hypothetical protein